MEDHYRIRRLFAGERVARFGTAGPGGRPHLMPVRFATIDDGDAGVVVCVIDDEPCSLAGHARLREIAEAPRVSLLVDQVDPVDHLDGIAPEASSTVRTGRPEPRWWIQVDAVAELLRPSAVDPRFDMAADALAGRYRQYRTRRPTGPIVWATVTEWTGWSGSLARAA